jgi:antitoxin (DNA-binding transcriptional repressor) of toxin-antitoxin stability system
METIIGLKDLRLKFSFYAQKIKRGESFIVVKRSKPLFKIVPCEKGSDWERVTDFTKIKKGGVDIQEILSRI